MKEPLETYEGDLWVVINEEGKATAVLRNEPTLQEKQKHVGGLIEYAPVARGARAPIPMGRNRAKMAEVVSVIVDEEGLLKGKTENTIATFAAFQIPFKDSDKKGSPVLVGKTIIHMRVSPEDDVVSFEEMLRIISGEKDLQDCFYIHGVLHYTDEEARK